MYHCVGTIRLFDTANAFLRGGSGGTLVRLKRCRARETPLPSQHSYHPLTHSVHPLILPIAVNVRGIVLDLEQPCTLHYTGTCSCASLPLPPHDGPNEQESPGFRASNTPSRPGTWDSTVTGVENSTHPLGFSGKSAAEIHKRLGNEAQHTTIGPMPVETFLDVFMKRKTIKKHRPMPTVKKDLFKKLANAGLEKDMYDPLVRKISSERLSCLTYVMYRWMLSTADRKRVRHTVQDSPSVSLPTTPIHDMAQRLASSQTSVAILSRTSKLSRSRNPPPIRPANTRLRHLCALLLSASS